MDTNTLRVLEYSRVLERLAAHCSNSMGREAALELEPSVFPEVVARRLQETREARFLLDNDNGIPLGGIHNIRETVEHAAINYPLSTREMLDVAFTVSAARRLKNYLLKRTDTVPLLCEIAGNIPPLINLDTRIEQAIADNGEVKDSATPELGKTRTDLRITHSRLMDRLNSMISSDRYRSYIQDPIITLREGRYCISVKSENKAQFGGIIHDASASGATVFLEPGSCVEIGNHLRELGVHEEQEIARILARLTALIGDASNDLRSLCHLLQNLDVANAKALLAIDMHAVEPIINRRGIVRLVEGRHPLLTGHVVPINVEIGDKFTTLLITGPNTGGKTVSLKTVGLFCLMAQSGMQVPAAPLTELSIFEQVFADIGDEQDILQSLSTFSAHLRNIVRIITTLAPTSLVLLDEVGAGTDPAEGAALAKALLDVLREKGARVIASTHYGELKEYAYANVGVENAAVEFDRETLGPTYRILMGVPGSSHAFYISERLGLPTEIVQSARGYLSARDRDTAELLQQIEKSRRQAREDEQLAARDRLATRENREEYEERVRQIADIQRTVREQTAEEARAILRRASDRAENILGELKKMNKGARKGTTARRELASLRQEVAEELHTPEPVIEEEDIPAGGYNFRRGDRVHVTSLGMDGELLEEPRDGHVAVQMGSMRATLPVASLRPSQGKPGEDKVRHTQASEMSMRKAIHIAPELMLRAMRVDEAAPLLEKYLDDAFAAGLREARIIHGKGTGALRRFVQESLKTHPIVSSYRTGLDIEGGDGATIVTFKD